MLLIEQKKCKGAPIAIVYEIHCINCRTYWRSTTLKTLLQVVYRKSRHLSTDFVYVKINVYFSGIHKKGMSGIFYYLCSCQRKQLYVLWHKCTYNIWRMFTTVLDKFIDFSFFLSVSCLEIAQVFISGTYTHSYDIRIIDLRFLPGNIRKEKKK